MSEKPVTRKERLIFDIETNGLLPELHSMWCNAITDMETGEEFYYGPAVPLDHPEFGINGPRYQRILCEPSGTVEDSIKRLDASNCDMAVAHNGITFDYLAIEKLYPGFKRPAKAWDSYVMAKVVWPIDILAGPDWAAAKRHKNPMPMRLVKTHSLKAWGWRLGEYKDDYDGDRTKYPEPADRLATKGDERWERRWDEWNPWMASYMLQDNRPCLKLWNRILERVGWVNPKEGEPVWPERVFEVEHYVAMILDRQERDGIRFDMDKAVKLAAELVNEQHRLEQELKAIFGSWWQPSAVHTPTVTQRRQRPDLGTVTEKRYGKNGKELAPRVGPVLETYTEGAPFTPIEWTDFQPNSRDHLGMRLQAVYGWQPKAFGKSGKPTVDESVLTEIPDKVMPPAVRQTILDYFVVAKTLGTLDKGQKAWIRLAEKSVDGRMHGRMDSSGAITGRGTHSNPNLSGTPSVKMEKVVIDGVKKEVPIKGLKGRYGWECRELYCADKGWEQTGVDASSLELIDLGNYLWPADGGAFSARVCDPLRDPHQEHADLIGVRRADAKTVIYLKVYGGSAFKLSLDPNIVVTPDMIPELLNYRGLPMILANLRKRFSDKFVDDLDDMQKARIAYARQIIVKLEDGIVGLKDLAKDITGLTEKRPWLKGMDGRKVHVRSPHAALNTLLQSAGAQTCKLWMMLLHQRLEAEGYVWGRDYRQVLFVHDELQFTHRPGLGPIIAKAAKETIKEAGVLLGLRGEYRGDAKHGFNWAETH